jgi:hypothetical protein
MNLKEHFVLAVRIIGLLAVIYCVRRLIQAGSLEPVALIARGGSALIGLYMIRGAPLLLKFAYSQKAGEAASKAN